MIADGQGRESGIAMKGALTMLLKAASSIGRHTLVLFTAAVAIDRRDDDRQLHDSDLVGDYNHRTGRLDAGNDPYGWYDED